MAPFPAGTIHHIDLSREVALFYIVHALPGNCPEPNTPQNQTALEGPAPRLEKPERDCGINIPWRSFLELAQLVVMFTIIVVVSVIGKNTVFRKPPRRKKND